MIANAWPAAETSTHGDGNAIEHATKACTPQHGVIAGRYTNYSVPLS